MTTKNESQCYAIQLQFDAFFDGEMSETRQDTFLAHINDCADCAAEFRYARTVHDGLLDLPVLDCSEATAERAKRLARDSEAMGDTAPSGWDTFLQWLGSTPALIRYAIPVLAIGMIGLIALPQWQSSVPVATVADTERQPIPAAAVDVLTLPADYTAAEIVQALSELNLAIQYLNQVSERTESMVGGRFLRPFSGGLEATYKRMEVDADEELTGDTI